MKSKGYMLIELVVAIAVLMCVLTVAMLRVPDRQHDYMLDKTVREIVLDLQWVQQESQGNNLHGSEDWCLSVRKDKFLVLHNHFHVCKQTHLDKQLSIDVARPVEFRFDELGRPAGGPMKIQVRSANGKEKRTIVIAASTGRIRIE